MDWAEKRKDVYFSRTGVRDLLCKAWQIFVIHMMRKILSLNEADTFDLQLRRITNGLYLGC